ncbi:hypothetical protein MP228_009210 [Amoeboaphelidium protococcarum]|nr:hypothetical protein MP228_009210 [Amoeboaphelidium protococcarum]
MTLQDRQPLLDNFRDSKQSVESYQTVDTTLQPLQDDGNTSVLGVAFNLVNTTVGAGIIGLSYAVSNAGFGLGIILTVCVAYLSCASIILMIKAGELVDVYSFAGLANHALGRPGFWLVNLVIATNGIGTMVSYIIILGSSFPSIAATYAPDAQLLQNRIFIIVLVSVLFVFPLVLYKKINKLAKVSVIGVACTPIVIALIIYRAFINPAEGVHPIPRSEYTFIGKNVFSAIGVMAFAFVSNQTAFLNYGALKRRNIKRWSLASFISANVSLVVSLGLAVVGYMAFGEKVKDNILNSFPENDHVANAARFILAFSLILTYPMAFFPTRDAVLRMLGLRSRHHQPNNAQFYSITTLIFAVTVGIALLVENLGLVYELVGGICSTFIAYIIPGLAGFLIYLRLRRGNVWKSDSATESPLLTKDIASVSSADNIEIQVLPIASSEQKHSQTARLVLCAVLVTFGIFVMVTSTIFSLRKL